MCALHLGLGFAMPENLLQKTEVGKKMRNAISQQINTKLSSVRADVFCTYLQRILNAF